MDGRPILCEILQQTMARFLYLIHGAAYGLLLYLHSYYAAQADFLWEAFQRLGWEAYDGPPLNSLNNSYYGRWTLCSMVSVGGAFLGMQSPTNDEERGLYSIWCYLSIFFTLCSFLAWLADGLVSFSEAQLPVIGAAATQITLSLILFSKTWWIERVNRVLKHLFLGQSVAFLGALCLGFYCWQWDQTILERIQTVEAIGGIIYNENGMYLEGFNHRTPENRYHAILTLISLIGLVITALAQLKGGLKTGYFGGLFLLLLYSVFIYFNNGSFDMQELLPFWTVQNGGLMVLSCWLFLKTEDNLPNPIPSSSDVLDDGTHWE